MRLIKTSKIPTEAIILAGGRGTRLQSVSGDTPKTMMPVCGRPFLAYLLQQLLDAGIQRTILSVGYRHETICSFFGESFQKMSLTYLIENRPLGTGGALAEALRLTMADDTFVLNGDSFHDINLLGFFSKHASGSGDITIAVKPLEECSRFGTVVTDNDQIIAFNEKRVSGSGNINTGFYLINRRIFDIFPVGVQYSFESDILAKAVSTRKVLAYLSNEYFIDIGIPDEYQRAQKEFPGLLGILE